MALETTSYDLTDAGYFSFPGFDQFVSRAQSPRYRLDDTNFVSPYGMRIPPIIADLLDIAASIMWVDRKTKRPGAQGSFRAQRGWSRSFAVRLGVRCYEIWQNPTLKDALEQLLFWLTEDSWQLKFEHQPARRISDIQSTLFTSPQSDALVVLYSGGLDSLAGTVELLRRHPQTTIILVSVTPPRLRGILTRQCDMLKQHFGSQRVELAPIPFHLVHENASRKDLESTQRTRGFLYFACGLAQAVVLNTPHIAVCENGIGMLNLPLNKRQLGTQHTRSVHPRTIAALSHFSSLLGFSSIRYEAPFFSRTKGELCAALRESELGYLCTMTTSCDSFPIRKRKPQATKGEWHCGCCTSCLLRRQAVFAAQLYKDDSSVPYLYNVCASSPHIPPERFEHLQMMIDQVNLFEDTCSSTNPAASLLLEFPELLTAYHAMTQFPDNFGLTRDGNHLNTLVELIRRYIDEWKYFPYKLHSISLQKNV